MHFNPNFIERGNSESLVMSYVTLGEPKSLLF